MIPHPAAEAAYWAVLSRNRIGDTATPERHREAIQAYVKERFSLVIDWLEARTDGLEERGNRIAELEAEVARLREALERIGNPDGAMLNIASVRQVARAALQPQGK